MTRLGLGLCWASRLSRSAVRRSSSCLPLHNGLSPLSVSRRLLSSSSPCLSRQVISEEEARQPTLNVDPIKRSQAFQRPMSPHMTIYAPQVTWILSIFHRVTGAGIGVLMYGGAIAYALTSATSVSLIETLLALPTPLLLLGKTGVASAFVYHSLNGLRHLLWDTGSSLSLKGVYNTAYFVLGGTVVGTLLLLLL